MPPEAPPAGTVLAVWDDTESEWVTIPLVIGSHLTTPEALTDEAERAVGGSVVSAITEDRGFVDRIEVRIPFVDTERADELEALLGTGLTLWVAGKVIGPDVAAAVAGDIGRTNYTSLRYAEMRVTFWRTEPDEES